MIGMYIHSRIPIYNESIDDIIGIVFNQTILEESVEERDSTLLEILHFLFIKFQKMFLFQS